MATKYFFISILICFLLLLANVPSGYETGGSFDGVRVYTSIGIELISPSFSGLIQRNNSLIMAFSTSFNSRGAQDVAIQFNMGSSTLISQTVNAYTDVIIYYVDDAKNVFIGSYFHSFSFDPINSTNTILYNMDLSQEAERVLNHFSKTVSNLTLNDVGFAGRINLQLTFGNFTGNIAHKGFIFFPMTFQGNFTSVSLDFTIPEEYDFVNFKLDNEDMAKIFPNRVQQNLAIPTRDIKVSELYLEWKIPEAPPQPPFYDTAPWKWIIPGLVGVFLTILVRDVVLPLLKSILKKKERTEA